MGFSWSSVHTESLFRKSPPNGWWLQEYYRGKKEIGTPTMPCWRGESTTQNNAGKKWKSAKSLINPFHHCPSGGPTVEPERRLMLGALALFSFWRWWVWWETYACSGGMSDRVWLVRLFSWWSLGSGASFLYPLLSFPITETRVHCSLLSLKESSMGV